MNKIALETYICKICAVYLLAQIQRPFIKK